LLLDYKLDSLNTLLLILSTASKTGGVDQKMCHCGCGPHHHEEGHREEGHDEGHGRRFLTKAEKAEKLKSYAEELKKELAAVQEHIEELSS